MQLLEQSIGDVKMYFSRIIEKLFSFMVICLILVIILFIFGLIMNCTPKVRQKKSNF